MDQAIFLTQSAWRRVCWIIFATLIVFVTISNVDQSLAAQYSCSDPPDEKAKLGIYDKAKVVIKQDESENSCSFSVDGVKAGSPPQEDIFTALEDLEPWFRGEQFTSRAAENLANLLSAAGELLLVDDLARGLRDRSEELGRCYRLMKGDFEETYKFSHSVFEGQCTVTKPNETTRVGKISLSNRLYIHVLQINVSGGSYTLILPFGGMQ